MQLITRGKELVDWAMVRYISIIVLFLPFALKGQQPVITSFSPVSGPAGSTVTISGSNFSTTLSDNIVYFGSVRTPVLSSTGTSLTVSAPTGSSFQPISITTNNLTSYSLQPFILTFGSGATFDATSFDPKLEFPLISGPIGGCVGDFDNDGKPDVAVTDYDNSYVSILRNTSSTSISFAARQNFQTGTNPDDVATADVDNDGRLDLVVVNYGASSVSVFLNTSVGGTISFAARVNFTVGTQPRIVAIGDLDFDGKPDLAVTNYASNTVSILKNACTTGNVSFISGPILATATNPFGLAAGDLDGDGKPELVSTNYSSNSVSVFRNTSSTGSISFALKTDFNTLTNPRSVAIGDMTGDAKPELAVSNFGSSSISVLRNSGSSGTLSFDTQINYASGNSPTHIATTDLDGDGNIDLMTANMASNTISVFKNVGTGGSISFSAKMDYDAGWSPRNVLPNDMDADGKPDLVSVNSFGITLSVLKNKIGGQSPSGAPVITAANPTSALPTATITITGSNFTGATDVNFGGTPATSFAIVSPTVISAVLGTGSPGNITVTTPLGTASYSGFTFITPPAPTITNFSPAAATRNTAVTITGANFYGVTAVSFGGTPASSFTVISSTTISAVVASGTSGSVSVTTQFGTGTSPGFTYNVPLSITSFSPATGPVGSHVTITGTNFNTTAADNIVYFGAVRAGVITASTNSITVTVPPGADYQPISVNSNGIIAYSKKPFIITYNGGSDAFLPGSFGSRKDFTGSGLPVGLTSGDFNGDGKPDMAAPNNGGTVVFVWKNQSTVNTPFFGVRQSFDVGNTPTDAVTADIDGDGKLDIIVTNAGSNSISVLRNTSSSANISFNNKIDYAAGSYPYGVVTADVDRDGKTDVIVTNHNGHSVSVYRNISTVGIISLEPKIDFSLDAYTPKGVCAADFDEDGLSDIATANSNGVSFSILKNTSTIGNISFAAKIDVPAGGLPQSVTAGDLDDDGRAELVMGYELTTSPVSLFKNTSTGNTISFALLQNYTIGGSSWEVRIADLNGDGKPDFTATNREGNSISVFKNTGSQFVLSFAPKVDYATGCCSSSPWGSSMTDVDGDGKSDLAVVTYSTSSLTVLRNQIYDPSVTSFLPTTAGRGSTVTISGNNFTGTTKVTFGGINATSFTIVNATTITAVVDTGATGDLVVTTQTGLATRAGFIFIPSPTIDSITPTDAGTGLTVTIKGSYLIGATAVSFGGIAATSFSVVDSGTITAVVSTGASGNVVVTTPGGTATIAGFTFASAPTITSFTPGSATTGQTITITGTNFTGAKAVRFGGQPALSFIVVDAFTIHADIGNGSTGNVEVTTPGGTATQSGFTYVVPPAPVINNFNPVIGTTGATVTITGTNFLGATQVSFGGTLAASFTVVNATTVTAVIASGGSGNISVTTAGGTATLTGFTFNVPVQPQITSFTPINAVTGAVVTITGSDFLGTSAVSFGGIPATSFTVIDATTITAIVATGASGNVSVSTPGGTATKAGFTYVITTITSVSPLSGPVGTTVTITGDGFNTNPAGNSVYFGSAKATVLSATQTSLMVTVPAGTSDGPINVVSYRYTASANRPFNVTFTGGFGSFARDALAPRISQIVGYGPRDVATGDLDGDGKPDLVVSIFYTGHVAVFRNTSTGNKVSFGNRIDYPTQPNVQSVELIDLNRDGKLDIIVACGLAYNLQVLINKSTPGNISFFNAVNIMPYNAGWRSLCVRAADIDGDGKTDLAIANDGPNNLAVLRHTTISGSEGFATPVEFSLNAGATHLAIGDIDGDLKPDIAITEGSTIAVFRNTSTAGTISFASRVNFTATYDVFNVAIADLDGDQKPELIAGHFYRGDPTTATLTVFKNISAPGSLSFAPKIDFPVGGNPEHISVVDMDGDAMPDILIADGAFVRIVKNISTPGTINLTGNGINHDAGSWGNGLAVCDITMDGKPDVIVTNSIGYDSHISILKNTVGQPAVKASGSNPVTGNILHQLKIDPVVQTYNGKAFVQRYYDIEPENNPAGSTATITLYYTQQEFDNFNAFPAHGLDLPTSPSDAAGKANLRVYQYHGFSASGNPGTYTGPELIINPDDNKIVWSAMAQRWEVTFDVAGFSGFFVSNTGLSSLPVTLISFTAKQQGSNILLEWETSREINVSHFDLERSTDGRTFVVVNKINARGGSNAYQFLDAPTSNLVYYYRLKMVDNDNSIRYSKVVTVRYDGNTGVVNAYPNPARSYIIVQHPIVASTSEIKLIDFTGRIIRKVNAEKNSGKTKLILSGMAVGAYKLLWSDGARTYTCTVMIE